MADILGPADAPNAVTARPAEERAFGTLDSWFKDCTSATAEDGTDIQANWLNGILGALRSLWRVNGKLADNVTPVVLEGGTDDSGIAKAMQHLIQRGQVSYGVDTGAANALVVSVSPAPAELKAGMRFYVKVKVANSGAATVNVNGFGAIAIKHPDGSALVTGDLVAGGIAPLIYDGAVMQLIASATDAVGGGGGTGFRVPYAVATGTASGVIATYTPTTATPVAGDLYAVKIISDIPGASKFDPDTHGPYDLVDPNGAVLTNKYAMAGDTLLVLFNGTKMLILSKTSALAPTVPFMEPGAIGSLGVSIIHPMAYFYTAFPNTFGPAEGYVYGKYVGNPLSLVPNNYAHMPFTGVWRCLSVIYNGGTDPLNGAFLGPVVLCQRIT